MISNLFVKVLLYRNPICVVVRCVVRGDSFYIHIIRPQSFNGPGPQDCGLYKCFQPLSLPLLHLGKTRRLEGLELGIFLTPCWTGFHKTHVG